MSKYNIKIIPHPMSEISEMEIKEIGKDKKKKKKPLKYKSLDKIFG